MSDRAPSAPPACIVSVVGTRPEAIKMAPVLRALAERGLCQQLLLTGQHALPAGLLNLPAAVHDLAVDPREQSVDRLRQRIQAAICGHLAARLPDLMLVQGDTTSAVAGAIAARACGIPLGHVEAGLRSFDLRQPWPEEGNRIAIDRLSDLLFAPTRAAANNLAVDRQINAWIYITGNTGIDALYAARTALPRPERRPDRKLILVTCHRRENQGAAMTRIAAALRRLVAELPVEIVLPLHPNRHVRAAIEHLLSDEPHITLLPPVEHGEMVRLMVASWLILTDSGGLQEEGPALGRPVLVLRNVTERPEAAANMELVGTNADRIFAAVSRLLTEPDRYARMAMPALPFGDGRAAARIADAVEAFLLARLTSIRDGAADGAGLDIRELA
ncbi:MAG TPA: UDP-N-acetylglucosamine 2-epimerase (non-hydrolyzing) [Allosphingosinicella sp.]|nr:UDP-N-acetylglucosamine 2-epimerase (non-hydrolyzing) [Allosphingosinicella sp.]